MEIKSQLNRLRLAPRKVRSVADLIKGKNVTEALEQLEFLTRRPALPIKKLIDSSIANAEHNYSMVKENLYIKSIHVDEGTKLKRFMPKGFGRASMIQKKTSHVTLILDERTPGLKREQVKEKSKDQVSVEAESIPEVKSDIKEDKEKKDEPKRPEIKREIGKKSNIFGALGKKIFRRKTI